MLGLGGIVLISDGFIWVRKYEVFWGIFLDLGVILRVSIDYWVLGLCM